MTSKTMSATIGPKIKTDLPGPNAKRVIEGDEKFRRPIPGLIRWSQRAGEASS